jgi:hypothetical protein
MAMAPETSNPTQPTHLVHLTIGGPSLKNCLLHLAKGSLEK